MQHFDVVVFDVDGTLLDTSEGVLASVKYTIKEHNLPEIDEEVLKTFIGPPIQNSFSKVYGLKGDILQELATTFRNQYKDVDLLKAVPGYFNADNLRDLTGINMSNLPVTPEV